LVTDNKLSLQGEIIMGLIKAALAATSTVLADQWKEYFICESIPDDTLIVKGEKRTSSKSSNKKGSDNIITNGSVISVAVGQCMLITDQGKVVEVCAEPGAFTWDASSEPSIFTGGLGDGIKESFKRLGRRLTFGGDTGNDQRVYFVNTKELTGNKFGTNGPISFRVVDNNIGLDIDMKLRINGVYSFRVKDPIVLFTNLAGNVPDEYKFEEIEHQCKTEFSDALQPAVAKLSAMGIRPNEVLAHLDELKDSINVELKDRWLETRGLWVENVSLNPIQLSEEDEKLLREAQRTGMYKNPTMAAAKLVDAQAEAMVGAANNESGAMTGFMGMGMAAGTAGMMNQAQGLYAQGAAQQQAQPAQPAAPQAAAGGATWTCSCGTANSGNFCTNCGSKKPEVAAVAFCPNCGTKLDTATPAKFCPNCGQSL